MTYYMQKPAKFPEVSFSAGPNPMSKCLDFKSYINSQNGLLYSRPPNINSSTSLLQTHEHHNLTNTQNTEKQQRSNILPLKRPKSNLNQPQLTSIPTPLQVGSPLTKREEQS